MNRRQFLKLSAALALTGCSQSPSMTPVPHELLLRSSRPFDLETPVEGFQTRLTPNELFFLRSHHPEPAVIAADWTLSLDGLVESPFKLGLAQLEAAPRAAVTAVLQCSGNGRAFFRPRVAGVPWEKGAVGNAEWTGARLMELLERARPKPEARWVVLRGLDLPLVKAPPFVRAIPLERALHPDTLVAYQMNGETLPPLHGYPARLVVPGWVGDDWVKWLSRITLTAEEPDEFYYRTAYRYPTEVVEPGSKVPPEKMAVMTEMVVKSLFATPSQGTRVSAGRTVEVQGVAWSGGEAVVTRVDVGAGESDWHQAELEGEPAPYGWRIFRYRWQPPGPGRYTLRSRATDDRGAVQPLGPSPWNPSGYQWNTADSLTLEVG